MEICSQGSYAKYAGGHVCAGIFTWQITVMTDKIVKMNSLLIFLIIGNPFMFPAVLDLCK